MADDRDFDSAPESNSRSGSDSGSDSDLDLELERDSVPEGGPLARFPAVGGFAVGRLWRSIRAAPGQHLATVVIVTLAVALLIVVTGVSIALGDDATVADDADFQVVPDDGERLSSVIDVEGTKLANVHERTEEIAEHDDVVHATPVLVDVLRLSAPESDEPAYVLAIGVQPGPDAPPVAGVPPSDLEAGDPHYANGTYDGEYTGDTLLSTGAATQLNANRGDRLSIQRPSGELAVTDRHAVTAVHEPSNSADGGGFPVAVFRLSELQTLTGADEDDLATQVLVRTNGNDEAVRSALESTFPEATIVDDATRTPLDTLGDDDLALALSATATILGLGICTLVVATTMGLAIEADRRTLAVLAAVGFTHEARLATVLVTILTLTATGATVGIVVGTLGIGLVNGLAQALVTDAPIATVGYWVLPYGFGVALIAGVLAAPYPLAIAGRTDVIEELRR